MQHEGLPLFIHAHKGMVKGISFSPREQYIFCSGATDGNVFFYNALQGQHVMSAKMSNAYAMKNINAVKYNADGSRVLATTSKRISIIDAERGDLIHSYENCAYPGRGRVPLASDPENPNMAICVNTNGKGIILLDMREQQPAKFSLDLHSTLIKDIMYLNRSWPYGDNNQPKVVSLSSDGVCKILTIDGITMAHFDVKHRSTCVAATPDEYRMYNQEGFESMLMIGGECLSEYHPAPLGWKGSRLYSHGPNDKPIYKLKYTSNGHILYAIASGGQLRRYRRIGRQHQLLGEVYSHNDEVSDMDISPNDEYIVTASRDGNVGLMCLGAPSFGWTGFMELA
uniref:Uncharacterized protein n=1 Tax=Aceria tosichella TaxID=561515 RepID=A0A6G1SEC0_9ACAR